MCFFFLSTSLKQRRKNDFIKLRNLTFFLRKLKSASFFSVALIFFSFFGVFFNLENRIVFPLFLTQLPRARPTRTVTASVSVRRRKLPPARRRPPPTWTWTSRCWARKARPAWWRWVPIAGRGFSRSRFWQVCPAQVYEDWDRFKLNDTLQVYGILSVSPALSALADEKWVTFTCFLRPVWFCDGVWEPQ